MGLIPDDVIAEIRQRADIVAVVGEHVELRKAGQNHKGLCPFHQEKTPSFNVNGEKGFFYCFGCQKSGDVFSFIMEYEGKSFIEAAERLAQVAGIEIPAEQEPEAARRQRSERARMLEINKLAAGFFRECLLDPRIGAPARAYLAERGIQPEVAEQFGLGFAPDGWRALSEYLAAQRVPLDLVMKVGLVARQPGASRVYDRFRNRLMCPVIVPGGEVVGFSGRLLPVSDPEQKAGAKYINSPESPVYKKSRLLFGLHRARDGFRDRRRAILVEGNFDVVHMHQAGFSETVAPLGTALAAEQVDQLRRLADRVVLLYDGDSAGREATLKALRALVAADVDAYIASLPGGQDPDSYVAAHGAEGMAQLLSRAQPGVEYFVHEVWSKSARSADGHARTLAEAASVLRSVSNPIKRDLITGRLAEAMGVDVGLVRRSLARAQRAEPVPRRVPEIGANAPNQGSNRPPPPREELAILAILADHPQLLETVEEHRVFSLLTDERLRYMYSAARQGQPLLSAAPEEITPLVAKHVLAGAYAQVSDPEHCLAEAMQQLERARERARLAELRRRAQIAKRRGDAELERQLVREILTTRRQVD